MKKNTIEFPDFQKLDIRVGLIEEATPVEGSEKLLHLKVDLGEDYGKVEILSGIAKYYKPEDISGKKFPFIANLASRQMMGRVSQGMIMAVDKSGEPVLFFLDDSIPVGSVVR